MLIKNNYVFPKIKMRLTTIEIVETNFTQYNLKFKLSNDWFKTSIKSKIDKDDFICDAFICKTDLSSTKENPKATFGESQ